MIRIFILILLFILVSCDGGKRRPSSIEGHQFLLSEYKFSNEEKLILMGLKTDSDVYGVDADELGFKNLFGEAEQIKRIDPKYLFAVNKLGIQRVYTFEYGNSSRRRLREAQELEHGYYLKLKNRDTRPNLPKLLIDVPDTKIRKAPLSYLKILAKIASYTKWSASNTIFQPLFEIVENKKTFQASYLTKVLELALVDQTFPELVEIFGEQELYKLGGSLRIRFASENPVTTTWLTNNRNKAEFFRDYIFLKNEFHSENMAKVVERANEEGLVVMPLASDMAILFYDLDDRVDWQRYKSQLLSQKDIDEVYKKYSHLLDNKDVNSKLVPLGIFTFGDKNDPTEAVDFRRPKQNINTEKTKNVITFALDIGMQFIPIQYVSTIYSVASGAAEFIINRSGRNQFLKKRIFSHAQLTALLESGLLGHNASDILIEALLDQLKEIGLDEEEIKEIEISYKNLKSEDELSKFVNEIYLHFADHLGEKRKISKLDPQYKLINKIVGWKRFTSFIKNGPAVRSFHQWLKNREDENILSSRYRKKRRPSANEVPEIANAKPIIMFLVGGLTPSVLENARRNGQIPNIEKFILKTGVGFDTFATQPLSFPTLASIFTGLSVDQHGLRSNSPLSRFDEKPNNRNYQDSRVEMISPRYADKSRSYRHLEESGAKWFFDELFVKKERYFNSLPIYNDGSTPIDDYIKVAVEQIPRYFNDLYKNSLALDIASGMKASENIRTTPNKYGLIVNWYRCPHTFLRTSNKALYQCIERVDKAIGSILNVAQHDDELKKADIYLISDAGFLGGEHHPFQDEENKYFLNNTGFNLTKFFAGDYNKFANYVFPVMTYESPKPDYDLKFIHDYYIQSFKYTYRGKSKNNKGQSPVMIDYQGDGQARLYLKHKVDGWNKKLSLFEIKNFISDQNVGKPVDIIEDLLNVELRNLEVVHSELRTKIEQSSKMRPVRWISYLIDSPLERESLARKINLRFDEEASVLFSKEAGELLILSRMSAFNSLEIKLIPVKNFISTKLGEISFDYNDQEFFFKEAQDKFYNQWITERDCLQKLRDTSYPALCSHFGRIYKLNGKLHEIENRVGEIPDLILYANLGFNFNSSFTSEADTGFLEKESSQITFYHTKFSREPNNQQRLLEFRQQHPIFERDIAPFILLMSDHDIQSRYWNSDWDNQVKLYEDYQELFGSK